MPRKVSRKVSPEQIRSAIFRLSNRPRADRGLIYNFDLTTRMLLIQVMIDPEGSYRKLMRWIKTSDSIPTWEAAEALAKENSIDLREWCKLQGWAYEDLQAVYEKMRETKDEIKSGIPRDETQASTNVESN
jgi:hypothetical protein